ncbi:MAG TPA: type VI secretion system accessory protein TagJ [Paraburkholderia sp.]|uniref:type VI secretion system accessory protein TagJ n=1 Tax=Paraburkholderia sp. TaxID=1926495 RepID=UPI002ED37CE0
MISASSSLSVALPAPLRDRPLHMQVAQVEAQVREQPALAAHRWTLFQLLCVMRQWERAVKQLQVFAQLQPSQASAAQLYRDLIRAERRRALVLMGRERPGFVFDAPPWADGLLDALRLAATGLSDEADVAREAALNNAPLVAGRTAHEAFEWIGDSDSRLGPICEIVTAGHYRWLPLQDIAQWRVEQPASLLDLIWAPCTLTLSDGSTMRGFMPARYPASAGGETQDEAAREYERDTLLVGCETIWTEATHTAVIGHGRKTWSTSAGDFSVFELASCEFVQPGEAQGNDHDRA